MDYGQSFFLWKKTKTNRSKALLNVHHKTVVQSQADLGACTAPLAGGLTRCLFGEARLFVQKMFFLFESTWGSETLTMTCGFHIFSLALELVNHLACFASTQRKPLWHSQRGSAFFWCFKTSEKSYMKTSFAPKIQENPSANPLRFNASTKKVLFALGLPTKFKQAVCGAIALLFGIRKWQGLNFSNRTPFGAWSYPLRRESLRPSDQPSAMTNTALGKL